jgi:hypothetical protein
MFLREKQKSCTNRRVLQAASSRPRYRDDSTLSRSAFPVAAGVRPIDREFLVLDSGAGIHSVSNRSQLADFPALNSAKVHDKVKSDNFAIVKCSSDDMLADIFPKPLGTVNLCGLRTRIVVVDCSTQGVC